MKNKISIIKGDITKIPVDVIVNAANTSLLGGGGVDGAIHRSGGEEILHDCQKIRLSQGGCKVGEAVVTRAGKLPAIYVIHTVGPKWNGGTCGEKEKLALCYINSLKLAESVNAQSVSFPSISTGTFRFPISEAVPIALENIINISSKMKNLEEVKIVCFKESVYTSYNNYISDNMPK